MAALRLCILLGVSLATLGTSSAGAVSSHGSVPADTSRRLATWREPPRGARFPFAYHRRHSASSLEGGYRVGSCPSGPAPVLRPQSPLTLPAGAAVPLVNAALWGADGNVLDIARSGNTLYIAGSFRSVGESGGGFVPTDANTGSLLRPFPKVAGSVQTMIPDGTGGWYIGGEFTGIGGKQRSCLAQIRTDGTVTDWNPGVTGSPSYIDPPSVWALARCGNRVFAGRSVQGGELGAGLSSES